jgi:cysteine-rich repeat protein
MPVVIGFLVGALPTFIVISIYDSSQTNADYVETSIYISVCSNGVTDLNETCDIPPNLGGYGSSTAQRTCQPGCQAFDPYCGDSILKVRFGEQCDDGNNTAGDLCNATCQSETAVPVNPVGAPTRGPIPDLGANPGNIRSDETKVVLRGKAYPEATVNILVDGQQKGTTRADVNADFVYTMSGITPGTATFGFTALDYSGTPSITTSVVFEVLQSAITTVANIFFPPTIRLSDSQVPPGEFVTMSGQTVPSAKVVTEINGKQKATMEATSDIGGLWALQIDTDSIGEGTHTAKSYFKLGEAVRSGWGRSVSLIVGDGPSVCTGFADINSDSKVNLIDFSIFLTHWNTDHAIADFNCNGQVNLADFSIMLFNWTG